MAPWPKGCAVVVDPARPGKTEQQRGRSIPAESIRRQVAPPGETPIETELAARRAGYPAGITGGTEIQAGAKRMPAADQGDIGLKAEHVGRLERKRTRP